jgi:hypothetical protein
MKKLSAALLVILAILSLFVAYVYFTKTAGNLPHFYIGYLKGSTHKHTKHGIAFIGLAIIFLLGAWMVSGSKEEAAKPRVKPADTEKEDS